MVTKEMMEEIIEGILPKDEDDDSVNDRLEKMGLGEEAMSVLSQLTMDAAIGDFPQISDVRSLAETVFTSILVGIEIGVMIEKGEGGEVAP